jgi:hypothetical protein
MPNHNGLWRGATWLLSGYVQLNGAASDARAARMLLLKKPVQCRPMSAYFGHTELTLKAMARRVTKRFIEQFAKSSTAPHRQINGLHAIRAALSAASILDTFIGAPHNRTEMMEYEWESGLLDLITAAQNLPNSKFAKFV